MNLGKTRRAGVELAAAYQFPAGHSVYANYAYTRATFQSDADIFTIRSAGRSERRAIPFPADERVSSQATGSRWCPITRSSSAGW